MEKIARFMETFWLVLAIASAVGAAYMLAAYGWAAARSWLLFPLICGAMWGYRRFMRGKIAQWAERERRQAEGKP